MGKKLFEVHAEVTFYVLAENDVKALMLAEEVGNNYELSYEISTVQHVNAEDWNSVPYGSEDGQTCGQIMEEIKRQEAQEEFFNKHQLKLFEEVR